MSAHPHAETAPDDARNRAIRLKEEGLNLRDSKCFKEAAILLTESFRLAPDQADVHMALAGMSANMADINAAIVDTVPLIDAYETLIDGLFKTRQFGHVLIARAEICRLAPGDPRAWMDLGMAQMLHDQYPEAAANLALAIKMNPADAEPQQSFINCLSRAMPVNFNADVRDALQICFDTPYAAGFQIAYRAWQNTVFSAPETASLAAPARMTDEAEFTSWMDGHCHETAAPLRDRFLRGGLRSMIVIDSGMENFLTRLRRYLCLHPEKLRDDAFTNFLCVLAEQCFYNEFVYFLMAEEEGAVKALSLKDPEDMTGAELALLGCYEPLFKVFSKNEPAGKSLDRHAQSAPAMAAMLRTHFYNPKEEIRLKNEISSFGIIDNDVSRAVQEQYEENPFPRWISTFSRAPRNADTIFPRAEREILELEILVAGCGTGQQAMNVAASYPRSRITAIDLSRASLAYAQRKANEIGFADRIKFIQADILAMDNWPEQFDMIESTGVLHHMTHPYRGWNILNGRLKPGGYFKIALYSELARQPVVAIRAAIRKHGFAPTPEGIRDCRGMIMRPGCDPAIRNYFLGTVDFFSVSEMRDLVFHVQERRFDLAQIRDMMKKLNLSFVRFTQGKQDVLATYRKMFPDDPQLNNLRNWAKFEEQYPATFRGMYQFWCRKDAA